MKFPRNVRIPKSSLDAAPWATIMFLLVIFLMLGALLYSHAPGVHIQLPLADDLPGTDKPTVTVAMDASGRVFYHNQLITEPQLLAQLAEAAKTAPETPTLVVQADKDVSYANLVRLTELARKAGIRNAILATLSRPFGKNPGAPAKP